MPRTLDPHTLDPRSADPRHRNDHHLLLIGAACTGLPLLALLLLRFPPSVYSFYPTCPIHTILHLQCPGCGSTRALAALLHGHLFQALRLNALTTCALPAIAIETAATRLTRSLRGYSERSAWSPSPLTIYTSLAIAALFTLIRNL